jgi:hypothetical protein
MTIWYTVEYDHNSVAVLIEDATQRQVPMAHGMRLALDALHAPADAQAPPARLPVEAGWCIPCREYHDRTKPHCYSAYQFSRADEFDAALEVAALGQQLQAHVRLPPPTRLAYPRGLITAPDTRYSPCTRSYCTHMGTLHVPHCTFSGCPCSGHQPWTPPALLPDWTDEARTRAATKGATP